MRNPLLALVAVIVSLVVPSTPPAVLAAQESRTFDTATIRLAGDSLKELRAVRQTGTFVARGQTAGELSRAAYGFSGRTAVHTANAPAWVEQMRFDIEAAVKGGFPGGPAEDGIPPMAKEMLRTLLERRFGLTARVESREVPVYLLEHQQRNRLGRDLKQSSGTCIGPFTPQIALSLQDKMPERCPFAATPGFMKAGSLTMEEFARLLESFPAVNRIVRDRTDLRGRYDLELTFVPAFLNSDSGRIPNPNASSGPSVFAAMEQQLGLKLTEQRAPAEILVITAGQAPIFK